VLASCSHRANGRINCRGSNRRWMKVQWQIRNRKNFGIEIVSIERDGKYAYQTARWTLDVVKDNGELTKAGGNSVRIFEEQPDGKWLAKVHIYNLY
jgi:ketosteroid isomerase-like protein